MVKHQNEKGNTKFVLVKTLVISQVKVLLTIILIYIIIELIILIGVCPALSYNNVNSKNMNSFIERYNWFNSCTTPLTETWNSGSRRSNI